MTGKVRQCNPYNWLLRHLFCCVVLKTGVHCIVFIANLVDFQPSSVQVSKSTNTTNLVTVLLVFSFR